MSFFRLDSKVTQLKYIQDKSNSTKRIIWMDDEWENDKFQNFLKSLEQHLTKEKSIRNKRNQLFLIHANENLGISKDIIIKKFKLLRFYDRFRLRFQKSKAVRSLEIGIALFELGIKTPKPIALVETRNSLNKILYSYYITEFEKYDCSLKEIIKDKNHPFHKKIHTFLPDIAKDIKKMHDAGIIHNDLHVGNILIKNLSLNPSFFYIDLNRGRIKKKLSINNRLKDIARLRLKRNEQKIFLKNYGADFSEKLLNKLIKYRNQRRRFIRFKRNFRKLVKF